MTIQELSKRTLYTNSNIISLFSKEIYEYDISSAGFNLCREYDLLPDDTIKELKKLSKKDKHVYLGKIEAKNKEFSNKQKESFADIRYRFLSENELEISDIVTIKKDAIFTTRKCDKTIFGFIEFKKKHQYTSYIYLKPLEIFYYKNEVTVKGISDDKIQVHDPYMIQLLIEYFRRMEIGTKEMTLKYLMTQINKYKKLELEQGYYRTFDSMSSYRLKTSEIVFDLYDEKLTDIDISYNYFNILVKLLNLLI